MERELRPRESMGPLNKTLGFTLHWTAGWTGQRTGAGWINKYERTPPVRVACNYVLDRNGSLMLFCDHHRVGWHAAPLHRVHASIELCQVGGARIRGRDLYAYATWKQGKIGNTAIEDDRWHAGTGAGHGYGLWYRMRFMDARPDRGGRSNNKLELLSDDQWETLIPLCRWYCAEFEVPKNFIRNPWIRTRQMTWDWLRENEPEYRINWLTSVKTESQISGLNSRTCHSGRHSQLLDYYMKRFEGFCGHMHVSTKSDPGAQFDWYKFYRAVIDEWWFPFDVSGERVFDLQGPNLDLYAHNHWEVNGRGNVYGREVEEEGQRRVVYYNPEAIRQYYQNNEEANSGFYPLGVNNMWHGGMHFNFSNPKQLFACANGELVAFRLKPDDPDQQDDRKASANFMLLKHDVYYKKGEGDKLDYTQEPAIFYSLYMHVRAENFNFSEEADTNPHWLNRIIRAKKDAHGDLSAIDAVSASNYDRARNRNNNPPLIEERSTLQQREQYADELLNTIRQGNIVFPKGKVFVDGSLQDAPFPIYLGDRLCNAGRNFGRHYFHFEVFTNEEIREAPWNDDNLKVEDDNQFYDPQMVSRIVGRNIDLDGDGIESNEIKQVLPRLRRAKVKFKSEWSLQQSDLPEPARPIWPRIEKFMWWREVKQGMSSGGSGGAGGSGGGSAGELPDNGVVWHYHPLEFMKFINERTRKAEAACHKIWNPTPQAASDSGSGGGGGSGDAGGS
jgi:hypothetical protein